MPIVNVVNKNSQNPKESEWNECKSVRWTVENKDILCAGVHESSVDAIWRNKSFDAFAWIEARVSPRWTVLHCTAFKEAVNPVYAFFLFSFPIRSYLFPLWPFSNDVCFTQIFAPFSSRNEEEEKHCQRVPEWTVSFLLICYCTSCVQHTGTQQTFNRPATCMREYAPKTEEEKKVSDSLEKMFFFFCAYNNVVVMN